MDEQRTKGIDQIGPKRFLRELQEQAPYYAKMLPDLPRLLHGYLRQRPLDDLRADLQELVRQQRRTNGLLQKIVYGGIGFVLGLIVMQLIVRVKVF